MKILSLVGTRPEIIKTLAFVDAARAREGIQFEVAHTAQNAGPDMADCFFEDLGIHPAFRNDPIDRTDLGTAARGMMSFCQRAIEQSRPDVVISNTDTDSAFYAALVAARMRVPVAHIEGGIRCEARLNPEEINRRLADHLSSWVFTISDDDSASLVAEGFSPGSIFMLGDITRDALDLIRRRHEIEVTRGDYNVLTLHRQENAGDEGRLRAILEAVESAGVPTRFPVHPRTRQKLAGTGLLDRLERSRVIELLDPQPYVEMVRLIAGCGKLLSDSGGLRREGYLLGKPVISLVWFVWFKQMSRLGFEFMADADSARIREAIESFEPPAERPPLFGDGNAASRILDQLASVAGAR